LAVIKKDTMRKLIASLTLLIFLIYTTGKSQSLGFVQSECGIISNSAYYYQNYQAGSHGWGFMLLHNTKVILSDESSLGGYTGMALQFIDDTTGFFVSFGIQEGHYFIYKIINDSVINLGSSPGVNNFAFFITSRHTLYFASSPYQYVHRMFISSLSDLRPQKFLVYDTSMINNITVFDTTLGILFCPGLNELNYRFGTVIDTLIYTIKFAVDTLSSIGQLQKSDCKIFPNPAVDFLTIRTGSNESHYIITISDDSGSIKKTIRIEDPMEREIYIGDLVKGFYFITIYNTKSKSVFKLIKI
jgi:hypothetical protein